ncbi:hypothetical protein NL676_006106 [Syzygium grande]|nr:hypothetical protein NL676_006106 [Syzygium grande]
MVSREHHGGGEEGLCRDHSEHGEGGGGDSHDGVLPLSSRFSVICKATKEEGLRMLLRLKQMMDAMPRCVLVFDELAVWMVID